MIELVKKFDLKLSSGGREGEFLFTANGTLIKKENAKKLYEEVEKKLEELKEKLGNMKYEISLEEV